jgi:hypothetical protein
MRAAAAAHLVGACAEVVNCAPEVRRRTDRRSESSHEWPLLPASTMSTLGGYGTMSKYFYVLGCQRSGTTLMKLILECHPELWCYDEHLGYKVLAGLVSVSPAAAKKRIGFKVPRLTEQLDSHVWIDHDFSPQIGKYTGEPIVFMLRGAKDTVASMLSLRHAGVPWIRQWGEPSLRVRMVVDSRIAALCEPVIASFRDDADFDVALASLYWRYKTEALFSYLDLGFPVCCVCYEQFVRAPARALEGICKILEVPWCESLLHHERLPHTEVWSNGLAIGGTDPRRAIDGTSVGLWTRVLSDRAASLVESIALDTEKRLLETLPFVFSSVDTMGIQDDGR